MKTTYDAVNEFEGEWHGSEDKVYIDDTRVVTYYERFNDLVSQMETNFGRWSEIAIQAWKDGDKELLTKSTKELEVMDKVSCYVCHVGAYPMQQYCGSCGHELLSELVPPQPALTYTQTMADNGELPSVGMMVEAYKDRAVEVMLPFDSTRFTVGKCKDGEYALYSIGELKPLTPPIELIDGKAYQFEARGKSLQGVYDRGEKTLNIHQGYYFDLISATNIQPLTVEVK